MGVLRSLPLRRLEFRAGKFALADFVDVNGVGSDSHLQFMNWTVVNNGAWDFAADTRGYTYAAMLEYDDLGWAIRFEEALMPKVAKGIVIRRWNAYLWAGEHFRRVLQCPFLAGHIWRA